MLETKRVKGIIKLGNSTDNEMIMSHKQGKLYNTILNLNIFSIFYLLIDDSEKVGGERFII